MCRRPPKPRHAGHHCPCVSRVAAEWTSCRAWWWPPPSPPPGSLPSRSDHLVGAWDAWPEPRCPSPSRKVGTRDAHHAGGRPAPPNQRSRPCWSEGCVPHTTHSNPGHQTPDGSSGAHSGAWPPSPSGWLRPLLSSSFPAPAPQGCAVTGGAARRGCSHALGADSAVEGPLSGRKARQAHVIPDPPARR